ncbi:MAG: hypothetical protein Q4B68_03735 [Bacteroidales bacterium]|nr:hypothetical protein [Bacteroidales bacterium]
MNKSILYFFAIMWMAVMWSCEGKVTTSVRADGPDTIVLQAGPDSMVAVIGKATTAQRLQLLLKYQSAYPDTISLAIPEALQPAKGADEAAAARFAPGKVVIAKISREESGGYILHAITDVTEPYTKALERCVASWTTADSIPAVLTIAHDGKASISGAPKVHYREWQFADFSFSKIVLKDTAAVADTATVAEGRLSLRARNGKAVTALQFEKAKPEKN